MKSLRLFKKRLEEAEINFVDDISQALWLLPDGTLIDGEFDYGSRGQDHRILESGTKYNRYDGDKFWKELHYDYKCVRLVPEYGSALIKTRQKLTDIQETILSNSNFQVEKY